MRELDRMKDALGLLTDRMGRHINAETALTASAMVELLDSVNAILNPVEYEEIEEIVGWVNVYQKPEGSGYYISSTHPNKESADASSECHGFSRRISCQPIKVTVQREKPMPVERSVTVEARVSSGASVTQKGYVTSRMDNGGHGKIAFYDFPECHGKEGKLTFSWTEDPTT